MKIDLYEELPNQIPESGGEILKKLNGNKLLLQPKCFGRHITVNRIIKVDRSLGKFLGLHVTDGLSSRKKTSYRIVKFYNTDLDIIDSYLNTMMNCFGVSRNEFSYKASYNPAYISNPKEIGDEWIKKLKTNKEMKYGIQEKLVKFKLEVYLQSVILRYIIDFLYLEIREFMKVREFSLGFIAAIIAAEGNVYLRKGSVKEIFIAQNNDIKREVFKKIIESQGIKCNMKIATHRSGIRITNYSELKKLNELNLCAICSRKNLQFKSGFKRLYKYRKKGRFGWTKANIIKLLSKKPMTMQELAQELELDYTTICDYIYGKKLGICDKIEPAGNIKIKIGRPPITWRLKDER